jgi:hypothetical protein
MRNFRFKKQFAVIAIFCLVFTQLLVVASLYKPKKAEAFWGIADQSFDIQIGNIYDIAKDIGLAAAYRIALNYSNQYLTRFVDQLLDKYKIRNYLYYDKLLTNWYMNQYIYDKVADPDLRAIYTLLQRTYITGESTGLEGGIDPKKALIPRIKQAIQNQFTNNGGVPTEKIYNPSSFESDKEYFAAVQAYFSNPPVFSEQFAYEQFSSAQGAAAAAASKEIDSGNGVKTSRSTKSVFENKAGERFQKVITAIENPAGFVQGFADKTLERIFENNFGVNENNIWSAIGSLLGNFIYTKMSLSTSGDTLNEYGNLDLGTGAPTFEAKDMDIDADGIPDGQDTDNNNQIDNCYHGGVAPNCTRSSQASASPYFVPICQALDSAVTAMGSYNTFITQHADHFEDDQHLANEADSDIWLRRSSSALSSISAVISSAENYHIAHFDPIEINLGRYSNYMTSVVSSLAKDHDLDLKFGPGTGGGGLSALQTNTQNTFDYLTQVRAALGQCSAPNAQAAGAVPPPVIIDPPGGGGGDGEGLGCEDVPSAMACTLSNSQGLIEQVKRYLVSIDQFPVVRNSDGTVSEIPLEQVNMCDSYKIVQRVAWELRNTNQTGMVVTFHSSRCPATGISGDLLGFPDNSVVDILYGGRDPQWLPFPFQGTQESGVYYTQATDPGDPADACYKSNSCPPYK